MNKSFNVDLLRQTYNSEVSSMYQHLRVLHGNSNITLKSKFCEIFGWNWKDLFENLCSNVNLINHKRIPIVVYYEDNEGIKGFCVLNVHLDCAEILWFCSYEQRNGFGSILWDHVVEFIKMIGKSIIFVHSTEDSLIFWIKRRNVRCVCNQYGIVENKCKEICNRMGIKVMNNIEISPYRKYYKTSKFLWDYQSNESKYVIIDLYS